MHFSLYRFPEHMAEDCSREQQRQEIGGKMEAHNLVVSAFKILSYSTFQVILRNIK